MNKDSSQGPNESTAKVETPKVQQGPSRRCRHWARGMCKRGESCSFLHTGVAGVHVPCRHFVRTGSCSRGNLCDFKHDTTLAFPAVQTMGYYGGRMLVPPREPFVPAFYPLRPFPPPIPQPVPIPCSPVNASHVQATDDLPDVRRSTNPCRHWQNGLCRLGRSCGFAHDPAIPQKFRTTPCRHWLKGACRLGEACGFAHPQSSTSE
jgi:hypothetical protein